MDNHNNKKTKQIFKEQLFISTFKGSGEIFKRNPHADVINNHTF